MYKECSLEITYRCNMKCRYCCTPTEKLVSKILPKDEIVKISKRASQMVNSGFSITGGEPFLEINLLEKVLNSIKKGLAISVLTNGTLLDKKEIINLLPFIDELRISLDDFKNPPKYRIGSNIEEIIQNIKRVRRNNNKIAITIQTMPNYYNVRYLEIFYNLLKKLDIDRWRIGFIAPRGRGENLSVSTFPPFEIYVKKIQQVVMFYLKEKRKPFILEILHFFDSEDLKKVKDPKIFIKSNPCSYCRDVLFISGKGEIRLCPDFEQPLIKDVRRYRFLKTAIMEAEKHTFFNLAIKDIKICSNCRYLYLCGGGCRTNALLWLGSIFLPDPICCSFRQLWEKFILPILPSKTQREFKEIINPKRDFPIYFKNIEDILKFKRIITTEKNEI